jgi:hypothetical protein
MNLNKTSEEKTINKQVPTKYNNSSKILMAMSRGYSAQSS